MGRTYEKLKNYDESNNWYLKGSKYLTTYYGQLSFKKIIARIDIKKGQEKNNALVIASDIKVKEI